MTNSPEKEPLKETSQETSLASFTLTCPHCHHTLTPQDFDSNHFTIAHLQSYFQNKEALYKEQLLQQLASNPSSFPAYQQIKSENEQLKLILEGYKLGTTKSSKQKGEDLEKYITERLQETYNGQDDISKITHVGTKADISQIIHLEGKNIGQIIYEVKNEDKWDPKWLEKLEKDMVSERAEFGILVAVCRAGQSLWKPYPSKNILVCDTDNFIFASQMARLLVLARQRMNKEESPQERVKKWEEWLREKLPNYLLRLEKCFGEWEKDIGRISTSVKSMEKVREEMKKVIVGEMELELKSI